MQGALWLKSGMLDVKGCGDRFINLLSAPGLVIYLQYYTKAWPGHWARWICTNWLLALLSDVIICMVQEHTFATDLSGKTPDLLFLG